MPLKEILREIKQCKNKEFDLSCFDLRLPSCSKEDFTHIIEEIFNSPYIESVILGKHSTTHIETDDPYDYGYRGGVTSSTVSDRNGIECFYNEHDINRALKQKPSFLKNIKPLLSSSLSSLNLIAIHKLMCCFSLLKKKCSIYLYYYISVAQEQKLMASFAQELPLRLQDMWRRLKDVGSQDIECLLELNCELSINTEKRRRKLMVDTVFLDALREYKKLLENREVPILLTKVLVGDAAKKLLVLEKIRLASVPLTLVLDEYLSKNEELAQQLLKIGSDKVGRLILTFEESDNSDDLEKTLPAVMRIAASTKNTEVVCRVSGSSGPLMRLLEKYCDVKVGFDPRLNFDLSHMELECKIEMFDYVKWLVVEYEKSGNKDGVQKVIWLAKFAFFASNRMIRDEHICKILNVIAEVTRVAKAIGGMDDGVAANMSELLIIMLNAVQIPLRLLSVDSIHLRNIYMVYLRALISIHILSQGNNILQAKIAEEINILFVKSLEIVCVGDSTIRKAVDKTLQAIQKINLSEEPTALHELCELRQKIFKDFGGDPVLIELLNFKLEMVAFTKLPGSSLPAKDKFPQSKPVDIVLEECSFSRFFSNKPAASIDQPGIPHLLLYR